MPDRRKQIGIGLLLPSSNTTQEFEFNRIPPQGVSLHVTRLPLRNIGPASTARIGHRVPVSGGGRLLRDHVE